MNFIEFSKSIFNQSRRYSLLITFLLVISTLLEVLGIAAIIPVVQIYFGSNEPSEGILSHIQNYIISNNLSFYKIISVIFFFFLIRTALLIFAQFKVKEISLIIVKRFRDNIFMNVFKCNWNFFSSQKSGSFINVLNRETEVIGSAIMYLGKLYTAFLSFLIFFTISLTVNIKSIILIFILGFLIFWIGRKINLRVFKISSEIVKKNNNYNQSVVEYLRNFKYIKSTGNEDISVETNKEQTLTLRNLWTKNSLYSAISEYFPEFAGLLVVISLLLLVYTFTDLNINNFVFLVILIQRAFTQLGRIQSSLKSAISGIPSYDMAEKMINDLKINSESKSKGVKKKVKDWSFKLSNVSYYNKSRKSYVLKNINIKFEKNKINLIYGKSGSGKSTLLDILLKILKPTEGQVFIENTDLNQINEKYYRSFLGYVPQDLIMFNGTIKENIIFFNKGVNDSTFQKVVKICQVDEFVKNFPEKYDTMMGEHGLKISGGQKQRICLARAIINSPKILILDEATSALDRNTEMYIKETLNKLKKDTTIIIVAHDPESIKNADNVFLLKNGLCYLNRNPEEVGFQVKFKRNS
tara:strand:- start:1444 stop:3186 length:1743 start_codon:yes stop_codon:yes gene_type:complete